MAKRLPICQTISKLFQPINILPPGAQVKNNDLLSKSYKLMVDEGLIAASHNGFFHLLPLATKALDKLSKIVDCTMTSIGAQKISCPTLTATEIWEKTERLSLAGNELFSLRDRHGKKYILNPVGNSRFVSIKLTELFNTLFTTHEESITQLLASLPPLTYKQLPLLLYQTTAKFRDEMKPRFGLIRSKEFLMKDLYSFDTTLEEAQKTYELVSQAYQEIFESIGVHFVKVKGCSGMMGGKVSDEFHFPAPIGDDTLLLCKRCGHSWNKESNETGSCDQCGCQDISETKGIEVGHMFLLGTRYSAALQATYSGSEGRHPLVMGSYGLGLTRILAASLEVLSTPEGIRWPRLLAPYSVVIITPKEGSKESQSVNHLPEELYWRLQQVPELENNVIIDDRAHMTIGRRLAAAQRAGYPLVVVVGKAAVGGGGVPPRVELIHTATGETTLHSFDDLVNVVTGSSQQSRIGIRQ